MSVLKVGSSGPLVAELQQRLKERGFDPGLIDGDFVLATEAAVIAFQKSEDLLPDGIVGPKTRKELGLVPDLAVEDVTGQVTVTAASRMFPGAPVGNIKENLPHVVQALREFKLTYKRMILMALATIRAETEGFEPINEFKSRFNTSPNGHPFDLYDNRKDLGNRGRPDGESFRGRGFIQLTGRANYTMYSDRLGLGSQLVDNPKLANDPTIAGRLLAIFLSDKERRINEALLDDNLKAARKLVNGGTHGLDRFTDAYRIGEEVIPG